MAERRRSKRVVCRAEARVGGLEPTHAATRLADLSAEGAYIDSPMTLGVGERAAVSFWLVDRDVSAEIEVVYAVPGRGMGVQFISLSPAERELIKSLVEAER
jgi:hypothetical protein